MKTLILSDTTDGHRNITISEDCFLKVGEKLASYGKARRYARLKGMWLTGYQPDWNPNDIPVGATVEITDQLADRRMPLAFGRVYCARGVEAWQRTPCPLRDLVR